PGDVAVRHRLTAVPQSPGRRPAPARAERRGGCAPAAGRGRRRRRRARAARAAGRAARRHRRAARGPAHRGRPARPGGPRLRGHRGGPRTAAQHGAYAPAPRAPGSQGQAGALATVTCQEIRELFSARVDDALGADEQAGLEAHLATCPDCAREWQGFERTVGLLRAVAPARAPAGLVDRVLAPRPPPWDPPLARALVLPWPRQPPLHAPALLLAARP